MRGCAKVIYLVTIGSKIEKVNTDEENLNNHLKEPDSGEDVGLYREVEFLDKLGEDERFQYSINNIPTERVISLLKEKCYNLIDEFNLGL